MCFYLMGRTASDGGLFQLDNEYWTLDTALDAAKERLARGACMVWIKDHEQNLILSSQEVKERLQSQPAAAS